MCYNVSQRRLKWQKQKHESAIIAEQIALEDEFNARFEEPEVFQPAWHMNGFTHDYLYCIPQENPGIIEPMRWGFVEQQAERQEFFDSRIKDVNDVQSYWLNMKGKSLNGKAEIVFNYYVTAEAIRYRRCLIPVTGFFESHHFDNGKKNKPKYPYFIGPAEGDYFALAGIYNDISGMYTVKILTAPANPEMAVIHNSAKRQPVMLHPKNWDRYLEDGLMDDEIQNMLFTDTNQGLNTYTVSKDVQNTRIDSNSEWALEEVVYPELNQKGLFD